MNEKEQMLNAWSLLYDEISMNKETSRYKYNEEEIKANQ